MIDLSIFIYKFINKKNSRHRLNNISSNSPANIEEPDWNALFNFGLPLNISDNKKKNYKNDIIIKNIFLAACFLIKNKENQNYLRHFDSFKALLLALKTHYPSKLNEIEERYNINFLNCFDLSNIEGKHIKLRNICLNNLSEYFRRKK